LQPELTPRRKSKLPLILGVLVVAAVIAVVALLALGGGDSASTSPNAKGAHEGLRTALDDSSFDDSGNDTLRDCPLGDIDDLYAAVDAVIEIDSSVANGKVAQSAREQGDLPGFVSCERYAEDESLVDTGPTDIFFQAVLDPPRDYRGYIVDFAGDATDTHFDPSVAYRGGTVEMFCSVAKDDSGFTGCDADWVDTKNKIALNVFLGGADATSEDAFAALKAVLPKMADNLAKVADSGR
jgi:hypothetical protein